MALLQLINFGVGGFMLWLCAKAATADLPVMWRLVLGLPPGCLSLAAVLTLRHPPDGTDGPDGLWRTGYSGVRLNFRHPVARRMLKWWIAAGAIWCVALDEATRHDFSRLLGL